MTPTPSIRSDRTRQIIQLIHEGRNPRDIAVLTHCHPSDVYNVIRKHRLPTNRYPGHRSTVGIRIRKLIVQAIDSGYEQAEVVALANMAWPLIQRVYREEVHDRDRQPGKEGTPVPRPPGHPGPPPSAPHAGQ